MGDFILKMLSNRFESELGLYNDVPDFYSKFNVHHERTFVFSLPKVPIDSLYTTEEEIERELFKYVPQVKESISKEVFEEFGNAVIWNCFVKFDDTVYLRRDIAVLIIKVWICKNKEVK